jgi:tripeptide aminopeptidase
MINQERLLNTFLDLVKIDNPSGEEAAIAAHVHALLTSSGIQAEIDEHSNVIAHLPGQGEPLFFNAHLDSVYPARNVRPIVADGFVRSSGDTVLGADDLAGVAAIIEGVCTVLEHGGAHRAADIVFTVREETGLDGAQLVDLNKFAARSGFTLDSGGEFGGMVVAGPSQESMRVRVIGKASHAGGAPEAGISAIQVAAAAINRMPLGRIDFETTANVGIIRGGEATNIVTPLVELEAEARSHDHHKLVQQVEAMHSAFREAAAEFGAQVEIEALPQYQSYRCDESEPILQFGAEILRQMEVEPRYVISGGGSDVNVFAHRGLKVINMSVGYRDIHTVNEHIAISDLELVAEFVTRALSTL